MKKFIGKLGILSKLLRKYILFKRAKFPELLSIEVTTACNSKCIMCPRTKLTRKIQHLSIEIFNKIIDDCIGHNLKKINLFWFGDPLANPNIIEYLRIVRQKLPKVRLYISTNAGLLDAKKTDLILQENLLDVINFDVDGITKATYESIRIGVNFDEVMKNIHFFLKRKKELNKQKPQIRMTIINMKQTEKEINEFKNYWKKYVQKIDVNDYNTWTGTIEDNNVGEALAKSKNEKFTFPCIHPWQEMVVSSEGMAGLCCLDFDLTAPLGDVKNESIYEIWNGEKLKNYRNLILNLDYAKIPCCKDCNAYIYQNKSTWRYLWD